MSSLDDISNDFVDSIPDESDSQKLTLDDEVIETHQMMKGGTLRESVGRTHYCYTYDCLVYYSPRLRKQHLYRAANAYPVDAHVIEEIKELGVEKVLIGLKSQKRVLEFEFEQYENCEDGDKIHHEPWGPQLYTPIDNAVRVWPNAVGELFESDSK